MRPLRNTVCKDLRKVRYMGKIEGIKIQNYGALKNIVLGKTRTNQKVRENGAGCIKQKQCSTRK